MWLSIFEVFVLCAATTEVVAVWSMFYGLVYAFGEVGDSPDDPLDAEMASWSRLRPGTPEPCERVNWEEFGISYPLSLARRNAVRKVRRQDMAIQIEALSDAELGILLRQAKFEKVQRAMRRREGIAIGIVRRPYVPFPLEALPDVELRTLLRQARHEKEQREMRRRHMLTAGMLPPNPQPADTPTVPLAIRMAET
ncbi:hypothetical protein H2200_004829 [Cladophialophora chaetospira]|uniref:Uncharacterized protein n=1 Tax=Cladophialophora chaetospira TaxID=386627 RepID=A0AA39CKI9_9EURO|nr:hypothetical protein H2200_004829 [Cladophialophora chaetospira]